MFKRRRPQEEKEQPQAHRISNDLDDAPPANDSDDASSSIGVPSGSASSNPILLVKMVMRRVLTLIITDDDRRGYSPVRVMKDIFVGLIWGLIVIVCLIFLDYVSIIRLDSAHTFHEYAIDMLNNPETLTNFEESGLKFMPFDEYELMMEQLDGADYQIQTLNELLAVRLQHLNQLQLELPPLRAEYDKMIDNYAVVLNNWCGICKWGPRGSCDARMNYFMETYNHSEVGAKINIMKVSPACKKSKIVTNTSVA